MKFNLVGGINAIGFRFVGDDVIFYMAGMRNISDTVVFYNIPHQMMSDKLMDEICYNAVGISYHAVMAKIDEVKEKADTANVLYRAKNKDTGKMETITTFYTPEKITFKA